MCTNKIELKHAILAGQDEIRRLRAANEQLTPRAEAFVTIAKLIDLLTPVARQGFGEDALWRLSRALDLLEASGEAAQAARPPGGSPPPSPEADQAARTEP